MNYRHTPVMLSEAIEYLKPFPGGTFIDCTLGGGGYTEAIVKKVGGSGRVVAIDADEMAINNAKIKFKDNNNVLLVHDNFKDLSKITNQLAETEQNMLFDGIVFDLGLSGAQLEDQSRGISFQLAAPLDMAFGVGGVDTGKIVNNWAEGEIRRIIKDYGEEKFANSIARNISKARKIKSIKTTDELLEIIKMSVPAAYRHNQKIHFATRTFQALRIATNNELENLEKALAATIEILKPGGRLVVISYHSLEDRIVKTFLKNESKNCICSSQVPICQCNHQAKFKIITKKPLVPSEEEIKINPRARSAKMRVAEKI